MEAENVLGKGYDEKYPAIRGNSQSEYVIKDYLCDLEVQIKPRITYSEDQDD